MNQSLPSRKMQTPDWVTWCVDVNRVIVIDQQLGISLTLSGLQAAVWSWFSLGYGRSRAVELAAAAENQTETSADQRVRSMVDEWIASGLVVEK